MHELSAVGSQIAAELGPESGEVQEFADNMPAISQDGTQPPVADLWYDDPRANTKEFLAERHWKVTSVDLVDKAANEYGRPFQGLPPIFDRLLRTKFLHRHPRTLNRRIDLTALVLSPAKAPSSKHRDATPSPRPRYRCLLRLSRDGRSVVCLLVTRGRIGSANLDRRYRDGEVRRDSGKGRHDRTLARLQQSVAGPQ